jgi:hypothetical protein
VHRIKGANGFDGKRPADASEHSVRDSDDVLENLLVIRCARRRLHTLRKIDLH